MINCEISSANSFRKGSEVSLTLVLANNYETDHWILTWNTPLDVVGGNFLRVWRNGERLEYKGIMVKRGSPRQEDYQLIHAGECLTLELHPNEHFDFGQPGEYEVGVDAYAIDCFPAKATDSPEVLKAESFESMILKSSTIRFSVLEADFNTKS